eukprot:TRINITY_DN15995_c0_g1_i1.p1 TRINITY_DN15995_c0_g1~~TRINITY_DN15995_c0_g1_i1.p1  ORF type:complete len:213 (+),score=28.99 TRINITY_DN15995_c0_g1_i1:351-989(+)
MGIRLLQLLASGSVRRIGSSKRAFSLIPGSESGLPWVRSSNRHSIPRFLHTVPPRLASEPAPSDDPTEQRSPPSPKLLRLVDELSSLTLLEVADLTRRLRVRLGMPELSPMGMGGGMPMMAGGGGQPGGGAAEPAAEKKEEKTIFDVKLEKFDTASKLKIIKEVRAITALGLKEAKELVEKAPIVVKKGVSKEEADTILEKLNAVGATCALE